MIIAIDGTASSGKGSLAKNIAKELNLHHLDTGIFYRVLASESIKLGINNDKKLLEHLKTLSLKNMDVVYPSHFTKEHLEKAQSHFRDIKHSLY